MSMIINPNATIQLAAELPSQPGKAAGYNVPADPATQGVRGFTAEDLGLAIWVLTVHARMALARFDRIERLLVHLLGESPPDAALEVLGLGRAVAGEVAARREAEAKAAAEVAEAGGVQ
jgi:hypothetical protein